jgi:SagB-type dehydrogenase family enzyme
VRFRRARTVSAYWRDGSLFFQNYHTRITISANPITFQILEFFERWRRPKELCARLNGYTPASVLRAVRQLAANTMLVRENSPAAAEDADIEKVWAPWLPEGSFHFATKDAPYIDPRWEIDLKKSFLPKSPQPAFIKSYPRNPTVELPPREFPDSEFVRVLMARKTHRKFSPGKLPLASVSQLLSLTWGVTGSLSSATFGNLLHKTSPSGGARHPGEVYLMALDVDGLAPGIYHYHCQEHRLETIRSGPMRDKAWQYCVRQQHPRDAAALFLMTAVFPRTMWKYHTGRAYRVVLLDAGHLCQTFCLVATWLGLAPFSTAAIKDTLIEKDLGIDGIRESVLYVAGVGLPLVDVGV